MKKIFILILFLLLGSSGVTKSDFLNDVKDAYKKYEVAFDYETPNYTLSVVRGICNDSEVYGIYFYSSDALKYTLVINGNKEYNLDKTSRGDIYDLSIGKIKENLVLEVYLGNNKQYFGDVVLMPFVEADMENAIEGNNKGVKTNILADISLTTYYMISCGVVILICGLTIFIFYKKRRGMFDKKIRSEGTFNFREFLHSNIEEESHDELDVKNIVDLDKDSFEVVSDEEENREVYKKNKDELFYSDEASGFDINKYLTDKGFITDYNSISDDEKNQIMLELIKLKNERKITNDEYLDEVYRLWKK